MSQRLQIELLQRQALSGKPESRVALKRLCSLATDSHYATSVVSTLLSFLSHNQPPEVAIALDLDDLNIPDSDTTMALAIFWAVYMGVSAQSQRRISTTNSEMMMPLRESCPAIHAWSSFLIKAYVEPDLNANGALERTACQVLNTVVLLFSVLSRMNIFTQEFIVGLGAGDLIVRSHMYALFIGTSIESPAVSFKTSSWILDGCLAEWDNLWADVYSRCIKDLDPRLIPILARILSRFASQRPLNYSMLHPWLRILTTVVSACDTFHQRFLQHRSVYFITHIIGRISKTLSSQNAITDDVLGTLRWCVQYLYYAIKQGGYDSISLSIDSRLLESLWRLSQLTTQNLHMHQYFPFMDFFGDILGSISTGSLYRSVQKSLERHWHALREIQFSSDSSSSKAERIWGDFKKSVKKRIALRYAWEAEVKLCSNPKCDAPPRTKVFRCYGCKIAFYCGRLCQKAHWIQKHHQECPEHIKRLGDGFPRSPEERDLTLIRCILRSELWSIRFDLLQQQTYRKAFDAAHNLPTGYLVNFIDLTVLPLAGEPAMKTWTLDEAKRNVGSAYDLRFDNEVQKLQEEQEHGPIVAVKIPHSGHVLYVLMILEKTHVLGDYGIRGRINRQSLL